MERSKSIISILVGVAAVLIVWRVVFYTHVPEQQEKPDEVAAAEPNNPGEARKPQDRSIWRVGGLLQQRHSRKDNYARKPALWCRFFLFAQTRITPRIGAAGFPEAFSSG